MFKIQRVNQPSATSRTWSAERPTLDEVESYFRRSQSFSILRGGRVLLRRRTRNTIIKKSIKPRQVIIATF